MTNIHKNPGSNKFTKYINLNPHKEYLIYYLISNQTTWL